MSGGVVSLITIESLSAAKLSSNVESSEDREDRDSIEKSQSEKDAFSPWYPRRLLCRGGRTIAECGLAELRRA